MKLVGLDKDYHKKAIKLSGGQKQRLSIARALAKETNIIVADEPTGNLDVENGVLILDLLKKLSKDKLVIVVTHNQAQIEPYATRKVRLHDGEIVLDEKVEAEKDFTATFAYLVYKKYFNLENDEIIILNENINKSAKDELNIYSESAILIEATTGKILYEKDMHGIKYPASTTKILTAIIAIENCDLNEKAKASYEAVHSIKSGYSIANIQVGEEFTISELLDVMLIHSANEAANVIAEHISGSVSEFAELMNKKAREIAEKLMRGR